MVNRNGGPEGIRTHDLSDANRTLSQLSYRPKGRLYYNLPGWVCQAKFFNRATAFAL